MSLDLLHNQLGVSPSLWVLFQISQEIYTSPKILVVPLPEIRSLTKFIFLFCEILPFTYAYKKDLLVSMYFVGMVIEIKLWLA